MPLYEYKCTTCATQLTRFHKLSEHGTPQLCVAGHRMEQVLTPVMVRGDYEPYDCPITGKRIEGKKQHIANLKMHGCRVLEPGETEQAKRAAASSEAALDARIEETAVKFVQALPSAKREQLGRELDSGLGVTVVRQ
jgi:putative FmdB family regulatory protein